MTTRRGADVRGDPRMMNGVRRPLRRLRRCCRCRRSPTAAVTRQSPGAWHALGQLQELPPPPMKNEKNAPEGGGGVQPPPGGADRRPPEAKGGLMGPLRPLGMRAAAMRSHQRLAQQVAGWSASDMLGGSSTAFGGKSQGVMSARLRGDSMMAPAERPARW